MKGYPTAKEGTAEARALPVPTVGDATISVGRRVAAEAVGTALLLAVVVGSGIMGQRLSGGNVALTLLANSLATGAGLVALILAFGPISGAHLNPAVTLMESVRGAFPWREVPAYVTAQAAGALAGVALAHAMFSAPVFSLSTRSRAGFGQMLAETVATFGLIVVIRGASTGPGEGGLRTVAIAVGCYIGAAYWFTSSTSFANPAVTVARAATSSFSGIRPGDVPGFVLAQLSGATAAALFLRWIRPAQPAM
jgi:glycerol uptake facilitator-like aquaporin